MVNCVSIDFDKQSTYGTGNLYANDIKATMHKIEYTYIIGAEAAITIINVDNFHDMIGYAHNAGLQETAEVSNST